MQAFQAAILEFDAAQRLEKVTQAKSAILDRIEQLQGIPADSERYELRTALQTLAELTSVYPGNGLRIVAGHES